ncbi:hypothetical protein COMA2_240060 [Candidatus Nitrospira nitrificans]|uniref:Uncharacterized protein n=1 Tax=Candidatus Nitrospira nitrificans TaxID=1742973 RepID=A0A0S4LGA7_9BACT|nr:hypothetical protein COMA2_240060 [Candidatus Nitrospira nitrificans]
MWTWFARAERISKKSTFYHYEPKLGQVSAMVNQTQTNRYRKHFRRYFESNRPRPII